MIYKRYDGDRVVWIDDEFTIIGPNDPHVSTPWYQLEIRSVQHTGTNFLDQLLRDNGWYVRATHWTSKLREGLTISPIRDPWMTYVTWISTRRNESYLGQWKLFNEAYLNNPDLWIVPVDTQDRDEHLQALAERLKCSLTTDWKPQNTHERLPVERTDKVNDLLNEVYNLPVVRKFYENNFDSCLHIGG